MRIVKRPKNAVGLIVLSIVLGVMAAPISPVQSRGESRQPSPPTHARAQPPNSLPSVVQADDLDTPHSRIAQTSAFWVDTRGRATGPGAVITHTLVISPTSTVLDTIKFEASSNLWHVEAPDITLSPGRIVTTVVTVTVPIAAPDRTFDTAALMATGAGSGVRRAVTLTSRTGGVFWQAGYVGCRLDLDKTGVIDDRDVAAVADRVGAQVGDTAYVRHLDLDASGRIDGADVRAVEGRVGDSCRTLPLADTAALQEAVTPEGLRGHLEALLSVAMSNGGHRSVGSAGYAASLDYVEQALREMGLTTVRHEFEYPYFEVNETPSARIASPEPRDLGRDDVRLFAYSGSGDVTAAVQAVDVSVPPGQGANSSTSGCEEADFSGFAPGRIALLQRGSCSFGHKARLAERARASAVIVFNEGQEGRRAVFESSLDGPESTIPVFSASYDLGEAIVLAMHGGDDVVMQVIADTTSTYRPSHNLIGELPGDRQDVILLGAHLDSVPAGPGINDNGSGASTVLEIARQMARLNVRPTNTVRFAFWGAEEIGLVGSDAYAASLTSEERSLILLNLNYDMLGSTNWSRFVYDGDETPENSRPEGAAEIEAVHVRHFDALGLPVRSVDIDGRSDHGSFTALGIPAGGLHSGTSVKKSEAEQSLFGGVAGQPYDPCYHRACDTVNNIDWTILGQMADAAADTALNYALDDGFAYRRAVVETPVPRPAVHLPYLGRELR